MKHIVQRMLSHMYGECATKYNVMAECFAWNSVSTVWMECVLCYLYWTSFHHIIHHSIFSIQHEISSTSTHFQDGKIIVIKYSIIISIIQFLFDWPIVALRADICSQKIIKKKCQPIESSVALILPLLKIEIEICMQINWIKLLTPFQKWDKMKSKLNETSRWTSNTNV